MKIQTAWRWAFSVIAALLIIFLAVIYSAPFIAIQLASHWYEKQGDGYQLSVGDWHFAPFKTELLIEDLVLIHPDPADPQAGMEKTEFSRLSVALNPWLVSDHILAVKQLELTGLNLSLELSAADPATAVLSIAGLELPLMGTADNTVKNGKETSAEQATAEQTTPWVIQLERLTLNNDRVIWQQKNAAVTTSGQIQIDQLNLTGLDTADDNPVSIDASIRLNNFTMTGQQPLVLTQPLTLIAKGQLLHVLQSPQWQGDVTLHALNLSADNLLTLALSELTLSDIHADAEQQTIGNIRLQDFQVSDNNQPLLKLTEYQLRDLFHSEQSLTAGLQNYQGLSVYIHRNQQGNILVLSGGSDILQVGETQAESDRTVITAEDKTADKTNSVLSLLFSGLVQQVKDSVAEAETGDKKNTASGNSDGLGKIYFSDASVTPAVSVELTIYELSVGEIQPDLTQPVLQLKKPVPVHLLAGLDEYNRITVDADLSLYARNGDIFPQGKITASVTQLNLVPFNGYVGQSIGYHAERGMLDVNAAVSIDQAQLGGEVKLLLRNSKFTPADDDIIASVSKQISMPVDTALDLLRDNNGNVKLSVPVSGDLSKPDVGLNDITRQLSRLALQQGAVYYLKQSLQPYGSLISLASYAGDYLMAIRLDSLLYESGQTELTEEHLDNLIKVSELMAKKSDLELQVCAFVSQQEAENQGQDWPQLAKQRSDRVKAWLAKERDKNGNSLAPRITLCKPQKGKQSEVVLGIN